MSPGAKIFLALAAVGTVIGVIAIAAAPASAAPGQPKQPPQPKPSNAPPDVIVPEPGAVPPQAEPPSSPPVVQQPPAAPPFFPPAPSPAAPQPLPTLPGLPALPGTVPVPPGVTVSLPNPLGGPPLGTFDPATGNVFGPNGVIIGHFNPATGVFTTLTGQQVQIPGFAPAGPVPAPVPFPVVPAPPLPGPPLPLPAAPAQPSPAAPPAAAPVTTVDKDTADMVSELLTAEASPGWNSTDPTVSVWQKNRPPLVVDGKFGPKTALAVAQSFGTIPLIRFWPLGSTKAKLLSDYQTALIEIANASTDPVRAAQLHASAKREQAQAFSTKGKLPALALSDQLQIAKVA